MLIDLLLNAPEIENVSADGLGPLRQRLRQAQKFELAPDFAAAAEELASDLKTVSGALPHCRLPYPLTWVEVAQAHRPRFFAASIHMPGLQSLPTRVGFLLEATNTQLSTFNAFQFWELARMPGLPQASHIAMLFDPARFVAVPDTGDVPVERLIEKLGLLNANIGTSPEWAKASPEVRTKISNSVQPGIAPFIAPELMGGSNTNITKALMEIGIIDWAGESVYLLGVLALLNTLNATEATRVVNALLNRRRAKNGKPPLQDHYTLTIHPRLRRYVVGKADAHGHAALRSHMVRGHWKVRRTGIYFWRPYTRGDAAHGTVDKSYKVEA